VAIEANTASGSGARVAGAPQAMVTAGAALPTQQRLRLGFLTRLEVGEDAADSYRFALEMFAVAEELGFDTGWIAPGSLRGLLAALAAVPDWRFERVREAAATCRGLLAERLEVVTPAGQAGLVTFAPEGDPAEIAARAFDAGVVVRNLPGTPWVRASCGWWTSDEDLERLCGAL